MLTSGSGCDRIISPVKKGSFFCAHFSNVDGYQVVSVFAKFSNGHGYTGRHNKEVPIMRVKVTMRCSECKQRNYNTMKNKKNDPDRLEMKKYCRFCKKHTVHNETK